MSETFESTIAVAGVPKRTKNRNTDNAFERETTITYSDGEDVAYITSSRRPDITKLLANPEFKITSDVAGGDGVPRVIMGTLSDYGLITFRQGRRKVKATTTKRSMPDVAKCGFVKADGSPCGSLASKEHGRCAKHKGK